jgi:hypothetical protein
MSRWKDEDWYNGHYELLMEFQDPYTWVEATQTLWTHSRLLGVWTKRDFDLDVDQRLDASDVLVACELMTHNLYGVAHLPNGKQAPCGCAIGSTWLSFFLPLAGLGHAYDVGFFPFADGDRPWISELDEWLVDLGATVFRKTPFAVAAIGSELCSLTMIEQFREGVPESRPCGMLAQSGQELRWYPPAYRRESTNR